MKRAGIGCLAALAGFVLASQAQASWQRAFTLTNGSVSASGYLTLSYNPNAANSPAGDYNGLMITNISGTLTDVAMGWTNPVPITGLDPGYANTPTDDQLTPASFQWYEHDNNPFDPLSYSWDNLLFPGGSPNACTDYPFGGGVLDIYGVLFDLGGAATGTMVDLWSNGVLTNASTPTDPVYGPSLNGASIYELKYLSTDAPGIFFDQPGVSFTVAVPEPSTWAMLLLGFAAIGFTGYRARRSAVAAL
jgi:PEP-CTERM motif